MKPSTTLLLAGLCAAGLLTGFAARRVGSGTPVPDVSPKVITPPIAGESRTTPVSDPEIVPSRSTDTLESLAALDDANLSARLALWLVDASAADIAVFWKGRAARNSRRDVVTDLVFLNWTRLDPHAAIAAAEGSPDAENAWRAWACNDPAAALAAAIAAGPDQARAAASGIGEFHPAWLRQHFQEIPEDARYSAHISLGKWGDSGNLAEMIRFSEENGQDLDAASFDSLVRSDPSAAFAWAMKNTKPGSYSDLIDRFASQLAEQDTDELARLAALTPAGSARRKMDAALFAHLLKTDPAAAIEQAKSADIPRVAAERFAAVGLSVVKTNPGQAFELAKSLLEKCPDALRVMNMIQKPTGSGGGSGTSVPGVKALMDGLFASDPARLMDLVTPAGKRDLYNSYGFENYSDEWVNRDVTAFSDWVQQQADPAVRLAGVEKVIGQLQVDGAYHDAAGWAMDLPAENGKRFYSVNTVAENWARKDPAAAMEWLEAADLPAHEKARIQSRIRP